MTAMVLPKDRYRLLALEELGVQPLAEKQHLYILIAMLASLLTAIVEIVFICIKPFDFFDFYVAGVSAFIDIGMIYFMSISYIDPRQSIKFLFLDLLLMLPFPAGEEPVYSAITAVLFLIMIVFYCLASYRKEKVVLDKVVYKATMKQYRRGGIENV